MAIHLKLQQKLSQQLVMTPQLQQAIKLLQLSHMEMAEAIQRELEENPVLEEAGDAPESAGTEAGRDSSGESPGDDGLMGLTGPTDTAEVDKTLLKAAEELLTDMKSASDAPVDATPEPTSTEVQHDVDWESYQDSHTYALPASAGGPAMGGEAPSLEATVPAPTSLLEHLRWQMQMTDLSEKEKQIGLLLVEEVDEHGYLPQDALESVCDQLAEFGVASDEVETVLRVLEDFDPRGVASRDLRACLLKQLHSGCNVDPIVFEIVDKHLPLIEKRQFKKIAKSLRVPLEQIGEAVKVISQLEPRPGSRFNVRPTHYVSPDLYIQKVNDAWVILHNEEGLPRIGISQHYRNTVGDLKGDPKAYLQDKMRSATWLMRSIQMRRQTLRKVMESILKLQPEFFEKGPSFLKPMILKDVADDVEMHESTISRVTTNKYVHSPQGLFELKYFFSSSINRGVGETIASESVRNRILELIQNEDPRKPLSDQVLVRMLQQFEINIARRTVAKYREMLNIPPSSKRRAVF